MGIVVLPDTFPVPVVQRIIVSPAAKFASCCLCPFWEGRVGPSTQDVSDDNPHHPEGMGMMGLVTQQPPNGLPSEPSRGFSVRLRPSPERFGFMTAIKSRWFVLTIEASQVGEPLGFRIQ